MATSRTPTLQSTCTSAAEVAAIALLDPSSHSGKTYTLGTQVATIGEACAEFSSVVGKQISFELRDGAAIYAEALRETPEDAGRLAYLKCISEMSIAAQKAYKERLDKGVKPDPALFPKPCPDVEELLGRKPEDLKAFAEANKEAFLN